MAAGQVPGVQGLLPALHARARAHNADIPRRASCPHPTPSPHLAPPMQLSHDNALNDRSYTLINSVLGAKSQRNGCPM